MIRTTKTDMTHPAIQDSTDPAHRDTQQVFLHSRLCTSWLLDHFHCPIICNMGRYSVTAIPPPRFAAGRGGQADSVPCSLPHYNNSIQSKPRGEHPLAPGHFHLHFFFLNFLPLWSKLPSPPLSSSMQKINFQKFCRFL